MNLFFNADTQPLKSKERWVAESKPARVANQAACLSPDGWPAAAEAPPTQGLPQVPHIKEPPCPPHVRISSEVLGGLGDPAPATAKR
jgi:hypothetical protein